jgi:tetratricopeptide (TPR) repeat protein
MIRRAGRGRRLALLGEIGVGLGAATVAFTSIFASLSDSPSELQTGLAVVAAVISGVLGFLAARAGGYALRRRGNDLDDPATGSPEPLGMPVKPDRISNLPPPNRRFRGREELLTRLREQFTSNRAAAIVQSQAVHGLGGVGKTQLALEYAHRYAADYDVVWWMPAEQPAAVPAELVALARRLGIPEAADQAGTVQALWDELRRRDRWLLIFDNVEEPGDLKPYQPPGGDGHVLLTSRRPAWGGTAAVLGVNVFSRAEAVGFLLDRTGSDDEAKAHELAKLLGDLPLALEQAAAYLEETKTSLGQYLEMLRDQTVKVLAHGTPSDYDHRVATTWLISLERIRASDPVAQDLLTLCAFLAPDDIPRNLPREHPEELPEPLQGVARDHLAFNDVVAALIRYSIVEATPDTLSVHRLVQAVLRDYAGPDQQRWAGAAVRLLVAAFPVATDDARAWKRCERLLPHALTAAEYAEALQAEAGATVWLLDLTAAYLWERGQLSQARSTFERALAIDEATHDPDHAALAIDRNNLGNVLQASGDLAGARAQLEQALRIAEASFGANHPVVAAVRNSLGRVLQNLGAWPEAQAQLEQALRIAEASYGPNHPVVAAVRNTLGGVLQDLGDLEGARAQFEQALAIDEAADGYGPDHPNAATIRANLGRVLQDLGDLAGARALFEQALAIDEAVFQPDHPTLAIDHNNLGRLLHDDGDLEGARAELERAIAIDEAAHGPDHPALAIRRNNLGAVLRAEGDLEGARAEYERALAIDDRSYGRDHPALAIISTNLAEVLEAQDDLPGARGQLERALAITGAAFGPQHPDMVVRHGGLGRMLHRLGYVGAARRQLGQALAVAEVAHGPDHPVTIRIRAELTAVADEMRSSEGSPNAGRPA